MANIDRKPIARNIRVALNFDKELLGIQKIRNQKGFTNPRNMETNSIRRITEAIPRHPSWKLIKEDIIKAPLDKKDLI